MYGAKKDRIAAVTREIREEREARELARQLLEEEHLKGLGHVPGTRADLCAFCAVERMGGMGDDDEDCEARATLRSEG